MATQSLPERFHFHPWAIGGRDGSLVLYLRVRKDGALSEVMFTQVPEDASRAHGIEVPVLSIASAMKKLGHDRIDVLKVDIEGAEYEVFETFSQPLPAQILVEFHHRFPGIGSQRTVDAIERLRLNGYRIFAVSETGREVSFLHVSSQASVA